MTSLFLRFLADTATASPEAPAQSPFGNSAVMFVVIPVMFYLLLIRPQQRQRKEMEKRIAALQKGDQVVTGSGMYGMVHHIKDRTVILKVAEGVLIEFDKSAVSTVAKKETPAVAESK